MYANVNLEEDYVNIASTDLLQPAIFTPSIKTMHNLHVEITDRG